MLLDRRLRQQERDPPRRLEIVDLARLGRRDVLAGMLHIVTEQAEQLAEVRQRGALVGELEAYATDVLRRGAARAGSTRTETKRDSPDESVRERGCGCRPPSRGAGRMLPALRAPKRFGRNPLRVDHVFLHEEVLRFKPHE